MELITSSLLPTTQGLDIAADQSEDALAKKAKPTVTGQAPKSTAADIPTQAFAGKFDSKAANQDLINKVAEIKSKLGNKVTDESIAEVLGQRDPRIAKLLKAGIDPSVLIGALTKAPTKAKENTFGDKAVAAGQAAGAIVSGMTTGFIAQAAGSLVGAASAVFGHGTNKEAESLAADMAEKYSYNPATDLGGTELGAEYTQAASEYLGPLAYALPVLHEFAPVTGGMPRVKETKASAADLLKKAQAGKVADIHEAMKTKAEEAAKPKVSPEQQTKAKAVLDRWINKGSKEASLEGLKKVPGFTEALETHIKEIQERRAKEAEYAETFNRQRTDTRETVGLSGLEEQGRPKPTDEVSKGMSESGAKREADLEINVAKDRLAKTDAELKALQEKLDAIKNPPKTKLVDGKVLGEETESPQEGEMRRHDVRRSVTDTELPNENAPKVETPQELFPAEGFKRSAEQQVQWWKRNLNNLQGISQLRGLSAEQIAAKMKSRADVQNLVDNLKARAERLRKNQLEANEFEKIREAQQKREALMKQLEILEDGLQEGRPDSSRKIQGPKTREAKANEQRGTTLRSGVDPIEMIKSIYQGAKDIKEFTDGIVDKFGPEFAQHAETLYRDESVKEETGKDMKPHEVTDSIMSKRINTFQAAERIIKVNKDLVEKVVPEVEERNTISEAIDKGTVDSLPERLQDAAKVVQGWFKDIGTRAVDAGVLQGLRENYVTHIVDWDKSGIEKDKVQLVLDYILKPREGSGGSGTSPKSRFGKERAYDTFEDLQERLKDSNLVLKTKDISKIYEEYARSMERAIGNRVMIDELRGATDVEGSPVLHKITENNPAPRNFVTINSPQMMGYAVHPDIAPGLKFVFTNNDPNILMRYIDGVGRITKRLQVMGSLFHAKTLVEANFLSGFGNFAKEASTGFQGTRNALNLFKEGGLGDSVDMAIKNGLQLELPEDVSRKLLGELGQGADWLFEKYAGKKVGLGEAADTVEKYTLGAADKLTWDYLHTGFKLQQYLHKLEKAKLDHPDVPEEHLAREIASHINNSFGGLNWFDVARRSQTKMGREIAMWALNPSGRGVLQAALFAPDWTISTIRAMSTAFNEGSGLQGLTKPKYEADFARQYQLRAAITYATIINGINLATSGHNIWDNDDPTRIELEDGSTMQLAKHSMEPVHWLIDPTKTLANKIGFVPRIIAEDVAGVKYLSPDAPKEEDQTVEHLSAKHLKEALPFAASAALNAQEGEGLRASALGSLGFPVYPARRSRRSKKEVRNFIQRLMDASGADQF